MAQGNDARGLPLLTKKLPQGGPDGQVVPAVLLVDSQGNPVTLAGSTVELDPPGPYLKLVDDVDGALYIGEAVPGTAPSAPGWRISRVVFTGDDSSKLFAAGTARFTQVWDDRLTLTYS